MSNDNNTIQCPNGCTHSRYEHIAFDLGREAAQREDEEQANPFPSDSLFDHLREIYRIGYSVGELEREAGQEVAQ